MDAERQEDGKLGQESVDFQQKQEDQRDYELRQEDQKQKVGLRRNEGITEV